MKSIFQFFLIICFCLSCMQTSNTRQIHEGKITPAAERPELYTPQILGKNIGLVVNQTSTVKGQHLVDYLIKGGIAVQKIFTPEHGFRGEADAGEKIENEQDSSTGISIVSLYGKKKKPESVDLEGIDVLIFDIQDVGVRFYTYLSTLHFVMEAAAEHNIPLIVLDRPNPLSAYIDGPVLDPAFQSFVGMHPVPVVYGMTIGEYALMINGESWLANGVKTQLEVIPVNNYNHDSTYILPVKPSPNLPNLISIGHYPSLCFFEGTTVSVGRGTTAPFQQIGHPDYTGTGHSFIPQSGPGAKYPKHENTSCKGIDLSKIKPNFQRLDLSYLIEFYNNLKAQESPFFGDNNFFDLLAGTDELRQKIIAGDSEEEIRALWQPQLLEFKLVREKYLIYE